MVGAIIVLAVLFVVGPVAVFVGGVIWSALTGELLTEQAEATAAPAQESAADG